MHSTRKAAEGYPGKIAESEIESWRETTRIFFKELLEQYSNVEITRLTLIHRTTVSQLGKHGSVLSLPFIISISRGLNIPVSEIIERITGDKPPGDRELDNVAKDRFLRDIDSFSEVIKEIPRDIRCKLLSALAHSIVESVDGIKAEA